MHGIWIDFTCAAVLQLLQTTTGICLHTRACIRMWRMCLQTGIPCKPSILLRISAPGNKRSVNWADVPTLTMMHYGASLTEISNAIDGISASGGSAKGPSLIYLGLQVWLKWPRPL